MEKLKKLYEPLIIILASISIILVILDFASIINMTVFPFLQIDSTILIIFAVDYLIRFLNSDNKIQFFKLNIFDLLAIIPFNSLFSFFRMSRIFRIARLTKILRLTRLVGITGKLQKNSKKFLHTNGLVYLIYISIFLLIFSSIIYSIAENVSLTDSLWWAMATATTVGYGDISPSTPLGRLVAILLMFLGIGFIGMLTSSITSYFTVENKKEDEIDALHKKIDFLIEKVEKLEKKEN
ncbi:potassium channel family protein [Carnobacterium gallinarum]|uniref:potassium channel family protein n=1 Tax=Carnobacterium gallinarum TaxID=2749 RepID=UPI0005519939|nr:potassium channel family protein [Carnobacterium gallinarum]